MIKFRWFLIGIALTAFTADYVHMKAFEKDAESRAMKALAVATRAEASNTACLIELAYNRAAMESLESRKKLSVLAQIEVLQMVEKARNNEPEAIAYLKDIGFVISKPNNHITAFASYDRGHGMGGY